MVGVEPVIISTVAIAIAIGTDAGERACADSLSARNSRN